MNMRQSHFRSKHRSGYSLIELLVVIGIMGTAMVIVTLSMHTLYRADHRLRYDWDRQHNVERLTWQLRSDAHAADSVTVSKKPDDPLARVLTLSLPGARTIEYSLAKQGVDRTLKREGTAEHHDRFPFSSTSGNFWIVDATREQPLIALHLLDHWAENDSNNVERDVTVIQAAVGLSRRMLPRQ
jgi:prepilin-type N-terminal cleavage/methylation domain-containing protein